MVTIWAKIGGKWYYFDPDGKMLANAWHYTTPYWYYLKSDGSMATGWQEVGGKWYYLRKATDLARMGGKEGAMLANCSYAIPSGGKVYHFNSSGVCTNP